MKKLIALILVLALAFTLCACGKKAEETPQTPAAAASSSESAPPEGQPTVITTGTLSMLNMTEDEYNVLVATRRQTGNQLEKDGNAGWPNSKAEGEPKRKEHKVVFYDTLDALLMALNAEDVNNIEIYQSVARYLCATNDNLYIGYSNDVDTEQTTFAELVKNGFIGNDFAFLMMEDNATLRDEFSAAIADMKADGTLDRLVKEQIDDLIEGGEITPVELPKVDGAETIKVAVTGSLPPMDYVAADGTPAGFNTAVLAEIGQRTGKNIEIVVVDSIGRAAALASGTVDAVFWTRTSSLGQEWAAMTEEERQAKQAEFDAGMTEDEVKLMDELRESIDFPEYAAADMPKGTITTVPYFSDVTVMVKMGDGGPQGK